MTGFFCALTWVGAIVGALVVAVGLVAAESAPQQAAGGAVGAALAVIPYVLFRCNELGDRKRQNEALLSAVKQLADTRKHEPKVAATAPVEVSTGPRGTCPNCDTINPMTASTCAGCKAALDAPGGWRLRPFNYS